MNAAWQYANDMAACNWGHAINHTREEIIPDGNSQWNDQKGSEDLDKRNHMITCLTEGMKRCIVKL